MIRFHTVTDYRPPEQAWVLEGVLMSNVVNLVIGQPKAGKTQLVAAFVASLTTGQSLNGCPDIAAYGPRKVLWVGTDGGSKAETKVRLSQYGPAVTDRVIMADADHPSEASLVYSESGDPEPVNRAWVETVRKAHDEEGVTVLVIDHLQGILGDRGSSSDRGVAPLMATLNRIGGMGVTVILLHHVSNKSFGNQAGVPMGHTIIEASARCVVDLRKPRKPIQEVFLRTNLTPEKCLRIQPLDGTPLAVQWYGLADERPKATAEEKEKKRNRKEPQDDLAIQRARAILEGPDDARANQSAAGRYLEGLKGPIAATKDGRQIVIKLIRMGLLGIDTGGRRMIPGNAWNAGLSDGTSMAVA